MSMSIQSMEIVKRCLGYKQSKSQNSQELALEELKKKSEEAAGTFCLTYDNKIAANDLVSWLKYILYAERTIIFDEPIGKKTVAFTVCPNHVVALCYLLNQQGNVSQGEFVVIDKKTRAISAKIECLPQKVKYLFTSSMSIGLSTVSPDGNSFFYLQKESPSLQEKIGTFYRKTGNNIDPKVIAGILLRKEANRTWKTEQIIDLSNEYEKLAGFKAIGFLADGIGIIGEKNNTFISLPQIQ